MYEELYKILASKELIKFYSCSREEYFSLPNYLKSHCDEQSNLYYRYKEMDEHQLVSMSLQLEQIEINEKIFKEVYSASSSLRFFVILAFISIVISAFIFIKPFL
nr:MAG TPA: structural protein [Bacteriophage sp.]